MIINTFQTLDVLLIYILSFDVVKHVLCGIPYKELHKSHAIYRPGTTRKVISLMGGTKYTCNTHVIYLSTYMYVCMYVCIIRVHL